MRDTRYGDGLEELVAFSFDSVPFTCFNLYLKTIEEK